MMLMRHCRATSSSCIRMGHQRGSRCAPRRRFPAFLPRTSPARSMFSLRLGKQALPNLPMPIPVNSFHPWTHFEQN